MNTELIFKCLSEILAVDIDELKAFDLDAELTELGMTSLMFVSFIVRIEEVLNIEVFDSDLMLDNFSTLRKLLQTLKKYSSDNAAVLKKVLVLDADNVLWKGISGEEKVIIDQDVIDFQKDLCALYDRGVLLCLCSKNSKQLIDLSFSAEDMLIKKGHFVVFIANRNDKASNIKSIADELNLSLSSFVFVDDSDYELGYVSANLPEISCIKADYSTLTFREELMSSFANMQPSTMDRSALYRNQKEREKEKKNHLTIEDYNRSLETQVTCGIAEIDQCARLSELTMRTNQFNLSDAHYTADEMSEFISNDAYDVIALSAEDKYGDMGIVGVAILHSSTIECFCVSCRVFDRGFENLLLNEIISRCPVPIGIYRDNGKNDKFKSFYSDRGLQTI